jgi:phage gp29-like protein
LTARFARGVSWLPLPRDERERLVEALLESTVPPDIGPMVRKLVLSLERTNLALESVLERLSHLDERMERARAQGREAAIRSGETWPFPEICG